MPSEDGKVVDYFLYKPATAKEGTEIRIPVLLVQQIRREKVFDHGDKKLPGETRSATFRVKMTTPKKFTITCSDIEKLRVLVFEQLDDAYAIDWEPYLLITVSKQSIWSGEGDNLEVSYAEYDVGEINGEKVHRSLSAYRRFEVHGGLPDTGRIKRNGEMRSLIRATPANKQAILAFCARIAAVREAMSEFLSPQNIEQNLPQWAKLLPAPASSGKPADIENS